MPTTYEMTVWAEGEARDAEGRLLNQDGNPVESQDDQPDDGPQQEENPK